jgi:hypothetical protein
MRNEILLALIEEASDRDLGWLHWILEFEGS